jgi:DNA replication protein DnaC
MLAHPTQERLLALGLTGMATIADAMLDRLVHNAHRLLLNGESLRKRAAKALMLDAAAVN